MKEQMACVAQRRESRIRQAEFRRGLGVIIEDARAGRPKMDLKSWSLDSETEILTSRSAKLGLCDQGSRRRPVANGGAVIGWRRAWRRAWSR